MRTKIVLYVNLMYAVTSICGHDDVLCNGEIPGFNICKRKNELIFVNETMSESGLEISDPNWTSIAPNTFQDLSIVELKLDFNNKFVDLRADSFNGLKKLDTLTIQSAVISLKSHLFTSLTGLNILTISFCKIIELQKATFADTSSNLIQLYMNYNNISSISEDTFFGATGGLLHLWLNKNGITHIAPKSFAVFPNVHRLHLNDNQLTDLQQKTFHGLSGLTELYLSHNRLATIHNGVFNYLRQLKELDLSYNEITDIEAGAFADLSLSRLSLQSNKLASISGEEFKGASITQLLMHNNVANVECKTFGTSNITVIYLHDSVTHLGTLECRH